ncbi:MAG: response regulator [Pseudomonadota bacterium]
MYMDDKEKRGNRREALLLKVQYPDQEDFMHDYTENISSGGTFIFTEKNWNIGDRLRLVLSFPGLLKPVELMAEVTWKRSDSARGIGLKFLFDEFPGTRERLADLIEAIEQKQPAVVARKYKILMAQDNPFIQKLMRDGIESSMMKRYIDSVMFRFLEARSGYDGLSILKKEKVDLIICDLYLPILDGFEMIKRVKKDYPGIPIIAVSAGDEESGARAIKLGADIFLCKPLVLSRLFDTICSLLRMRPAEE